MGITHQLPLFPGSAVLNEQTEKKLKKVYEEAGELNCYVLTDPKYWNDKWTVCPLCGGTENEEGVFVHNPIQ